MFLESRGLQLGEIVKVRYQNGVPFVKVRILRWCTPEQDFISNWARVVLPFGTYNYGTWATPVVGEKVWVAFEGGDPQRPVVIGYAPVKHDPIEMPPEFGNDSPHDKSKPGDREDPPENYSKPVHAWLAKTKLGHFILLHDKIKKEIIRSEGKIELGELAKHNVLLGDLFMQLYNNHTHQDSVPPPGDGEKIIPEEHLSQVVFVIRDLGEQPPSSNSMGMIKQATALMQNTQAGGGGGGVQDLLGDPQGFLRDIGRELGLDGETIQKAQEILDGFIDGFVDTVHNLAEQAGIDIPDGLDLQGLFNWFGDTIGQFVGTVLSEAERIAEEALGISLPEDLSLSGLLRWAQENFGEYLDAFVDFVVGAIGDYLGIELPSDLSLDGLVDWVGSNIDGIVSKAFSLALNAIGVPPGVSDAVANIATGLLFGNPQATLGDLLGAVSSIVPGGEALGTALCQALAGCFNLGLGLSL